jgi:hypothetical protein
MSDRVALALEAIQKMRGSRGWRELGARAQSALESDVRQIESALRGGDAYAQALDVFDLQRQSASARGGSGGNKGDPPAEPPKPPPPPATADIGARAAAALEAVAFPAFVASLITGTFDAIVEASITQVEAYGRLVASISQSLDDFTRDNVTLNQARDTLAERHGQDLVILFPKTGETGQPRLVPRPGREGESPSWLARYDLSGQELSEELTEGALLQKGRLSSGEDRLQSLATMVLMGINRIVVNEGEVRARLQFHATARDKLQAEAQQMGVAVASRGMSAASTQMMVSTVKANSQADSTIKTDLMGEVRVNFRSETFPLERFADSAAIQLMNRHARWKTEPSSEPQPAPAPAAPAATAPAATAPPPAGGTAPGGGGAT